MRTSEGITQCTGMSGRTGLFNGYSRAFYPTVPVIDSGFTEKIDRSTVEIVNQGITRRIYYGRINIVMLLGQTVRKSCGWGFHRL